MVTAICQHTGVEFEARSKAAKNHPQVATELDRVVKSSREAYSLLMQALSAAKARGEQPTLEEFSALADEAISAGREARAVNNAHWQQVKAANREARRNHDHPDNTSNLELMAEAGGSSYADPDVTEG